MAGIDICALEGIARHIHEESQADERPSALDLAWACGFEVEHGGGGSRLAGKRIIVPIRTRLTRVEGLVAHELAHGLLIAFGEQESERAARYLGGALLVPRATLRRDLLATGFDLAALARLWPHVSHELLARRVTELRDATGAVFDHGRFRYRFWSPWAVSTREAEPRETELADLALREGAQVQAEGECATPLLEPGWRRVIVLRAAG